MSVRKFGRVAGVVLALALLVGGAGAAAGTSPETSAESALTLEITWD